MALLEKARQISLEQSQENRQKIDLLEKENHKLELDVQDKQQRLESLEEEKQKMVVTRESSSDQHADLERKLKAQTERINSTNSRIEAFRALLQSKDNEIEAIKSISSLFTENEPLTILHSSDYGSILNTLACIITTEFSTYNEQVELKFKQKIDHLNNLSN